ncbi:uncharacterized protein BDW70DRAFT_171367 [Aspergillus foveolatus]|uniref:uncharacterized protein n=1 Tax=Aspergillus foveolatus TaxID=210207 RepID=UPI003CCE1BD5
MGVLRALCCGKGDVKGDGPDTAVRPTQKHPEKGTQSAPPNAKQDTSSDMTGDKSSSGMKPPLEEKPSPRDLWKEAFDGLDESRKKYVPADGLSTTGAIQGVIDSTTAKYKEWKKGGLKIHQKSGKDINLRDTAEKILGAAMKAKDVISTAVSFDPTGHASSAWTVISFGMSVIQNRLDRRDAIFDSSAYLAETLSYYALVDTKYRDQGIGTDKHLDHALLRVYSAILEFTAEVKKGQDENEAARTWHSIFAITDQPLEQLKASIHAQNAVAEKWLSLSANLGDRKRAEEHLAKTDKAIEIARNIESKVLTAEEEDQLVWISKADFSARQRNLQKKRTADTGIWLLDSQEYNDWKYTPGSILWLPGISGCGKSVLCSTVIQDLEEVCQLDPSKLLAYWYFQFDVDETKNVDALTRSLIRQLSRSPLLPSVTKMWEQHHLRGSQPDSKSISYVLDDVLSSISGNIYLVFDALDECPENAHYKERGSLLSLLVGLLERHKNKVHILATSRPEQDIKQVLEKSPRVDLEARLDKDVKTFVNTSIAQGPLKDLKDEEIKKMIVDQLLSSKERRFRWAELQIAELEQCRKKEHIEEALRSIPQTLEETYRKILDGMVPRDVPLAREILMVICLSPVLLDLKMVAAMVELENHVSVLHICTTSLVSEFDNKVQVAHFSVKEFLIVSEEDGQHHKCQFSATNGHKFLGTKTVDSLLEQTEDLTEADARERLFLLYAAKYWDTHVAAMGDIDRSCMMGITAAHGVKCFKNTHHQFIEPRAWGYSKP